MPEGTRSISYPPGPRRPDVASEALAGLTARRKTLPAKLFYDKEGCRLFGLITALPEYYPTRTEMALMRRVGPEIGRAVPGGAVVVEYGAGDEAKATLLLDSLDNPRAYVPIDIAGEELAAAADRLQVRRPELDIVPLALDFLAPFALPPAFRGYPHLGFFPGSTIGNLEPHAARVFLRQARASLGGGAQFLIGVDLRKDERILIPAYDDSAGVTAAFNRNVLVRLNREADADFNPDRFEHAAVWNDQESRIEMHLVSRGAQVAQVAGRRIVFAAGETIHTESSYKHTVEGFRALALSAGWQPAHVWMDTDEYFSLHLLQATA